MIMNKEQITAFNEANIAEFRASGGRLATFGSAPVLLLTTTGARSGQRRANPMMYLADDRDANRIYVFASAAGSDNNPAWFHNLVANPHDMGVEVGTANLRADADVLPEPDRATVFAKQARRFSGFAHYQSMTQRPIPVVGLNLKSALPRPLPRRHGAARADRAVEPWLTAHAWSSSLRCSLGTSASSASWPSTRPGVRAELAPMARMRNRLVHHYEDIAAERVHEVLITRLGDCDRFAEQVLGYADRS